MDTPHQPAERPQDVDVASHLRHELRTPLNHIIGYSEMLKEEAQERGLDAFVADLSRIGEAARTLQQLIERHVVAGREGTDYAGSGGDSNVIGGPHTPPHLGTHADTHALDTTLAADEIRSQIAAVRHALPEAFDVGSTLGARLLVVDDSEPNRDMLSRRLRDKGYDVLCAADGTVALQMLANEDFDLILLDVMMPGISGLDVLRTLRRTYAASDLPVIMVTAMDRSDDTVVALKLGANDYVTKPLDFQVVLARTETQLALSRAKRRIDQLASDLEARNAFIRATFDRYISADIAENLLQTAAKEPTLTGEARTVTILIADLRGFTTLVQQLEPEQVVRVLNRFLGTMTDVVSEFDGTVDEFVGDEIVAFFGAPTGRMDDALRAVACAVQMQLTMSQVNRANERDGLPRLEMGVGLDTGSVIVGSVGSLVRAKYTAVGTSVNLAARIESCTVGGQVLISSSTRDAAGSAVEVRHPLFIEAKGFRDSIAMYEVLGVGAPYELALRRGVEDLRPLDRPLSVLCALLEEKHVESSRFEGALIRLGEESAALRAEHPLSELDNLQMRVVRLDGRELEGYLYAKVVIGPSSQEDGAIVRFTGMHSDVAEFLREQRMAPA